MECVSEGTRKMKVIPIVSRRTYRRVSVSKIDREQLLELAKEPGRTDIANQSQVDFGTIFGVEHELVAHVCSLQAHLGGARWLPFVTCCGRIRVCKPWQRIVRPATFGVDGEGAR